MEDIDALARILQRQKVYCIVSAVDWDDAYEQAMRHFESVVKIPPKYLKELNPRRMPT